jgi:hypothetical protein
MTTDEARMAKRFKDGYQEAAGNNERNIHVNMSSVRHTATGAFLSPDAYLRS